MVVTVTQGGYIKRVPLSTYRAQKRGGKGRSGLNMHDDDVTVKVYVTNTHTPMLYFSTSGKVYKQKVYKLPLGGPQSKGRALVNLLPLEKDETINVVMPMPENEDEWDNLNIMFATNKGTVRRNNLSDFKRVQSNGKIAMKLDEGDRLVAVRACDESQHIVLSARSGKCIRFPAEAVREFKSRASTGVRGIKLSENDEVVSMAILNGTEIDVEVRKEYLRIPSPTRIELNQLLNSEEVDEAAVDAIYNSVEECSLARDEVLRLARDEQFILTITENGYGKRTSAYEYRVTNRGGTGIVNIVTSSRNGNVAACYQIAQTDQIILITTSGKLIRTPIGDVRVASRNTQGVTIFRTADSEKVVSVARINETEARGNEQYDDEEEGEEGGENATETTASLEQETTVSPESEGDA
jgi:DNA gyrase subunit A